MLISVWLTGKSTHLGSSGAKKLIKKKLSGSFEQQQIMGPLIIGWVSFGQLSSLARIENSTKSLLTKKEVYARWNDPCYKVAQNEKRIKYNIKNIK